MSRRRQRRSVTAFVRRPSIRHVVAVTGNAAGLPLQLDDERTIDQAILQTHGRRRVAEVVAPGTMVDVRYHCCRALLVARR